jgi:queuosine precursor transporter
MSEEQSQYGSMRASDKLFVCLAAVFVSCLLLGDVIGGKTVGTPLGPISVGIIPFPVTFLLTDVVNDFYGRRGARFLTLVGFAMALLSYVVLQLSTWLTPHESTYFTQAEFSKIFGGSAQLFVASMIAYLLGQFLDISVFQFWKALTQSKHLWLRATGSTLLSQIVDTVVINLIFWLWTASADPNSFLGKMTAGERYGWIFAKIGREYGIKVVVAILLTPVVYAIHAFVVRVMNIAPAAAEKRG